MKEIAGKIKALALELGFSECGISGATYLRDDHLHLKNWLNKGYHAGMQWMKNHEEKRVDPRELVPGAKSVISVLYNYYQPVHREAGNPKISMYAQGTDYHFVMKRKLKSFLYLINEKIASVNGRVFVDSAPVLDRAWAVRSGLGWVGKNSMLINKGKGSYFFIGELITDLELPADSPVTDHCGTCTACIDACPTDAIVADKVIDANLCISYQTIENRSDEIPHFLKDKMEDWVFGCDICQDVCPWNKFSEPHAEPEFLPDPDLNRSIEGWEQMTREEFNKALRKSPVKRAGYDGIKRNVKFITKEDHG